MHVCTSQLVLPIVFIVHLFNIVFYFFYYPYGLLSEIKYYYYYYFDMCNTNGDIHIYINIFVEFKVPVIEGTKDINPGSAAVLCGYAPHHAPESFQYTLW